MSCNRSVLAIFSALAICLSRGDAQETNYLDANGYRLPGPSQVVGGSESLAGLKDPVDNSPYQIEADSLKLECLGDYRRILNGDYLALPGGGLAALIAATDQDSFGLSLEAGAVQLAPASTAAANVANPRFLQTGLIARHYFTPSHVFLRPYITLNASYFWSAWDYRTPVTSDDGTLIDGDSAEGIDASAGVGLSVRLHRHMNLFGEFSSGGVAMLPFTEGGVDNNFMGSFGYLGAKAGLSFVF
jgi:hypothetical protein